MEPLWSRTLVKARLRNRLYDRLAQALIDHGECLMGFPFRVLDYREPWIADVGFVTAKRLVEPVQDECFDGSPDLVAMVLESHHRVEEVNEWIDLCFDSGCVEFWIVEPNRSIIQVCYRDGSGRWHAPGDSITLRAAPEAVVTVESIFAEDEND